MDISVSFCLLLCSLTLIHTNTATDGPVVETKLGTIVGIYQDVVVFGKAVKVETYQGIPYAEPPLDELRFRKPVPKTSFDSPYRAVKHGNACYQSGAMPLVKDVTIDEDCLFLNVYAPAGRKENLAVMVWIYGGGFIAGASDTYPSHALAVHGNVIVVTFNYRLSLWGFLSTGDEHAAGNYGLLDQHLAIKWVHENIKNFGGDPGRVTIFGESAGAASVVYQSVFESNRGLFHRAIAQSGSCIMTWASQEDPKKDAETLGKAVGCENLESGPLVECLRNVSAPRLSAALDDPRNGFVSFFPFPFVPSADGEFIQQSPARLFDTDSGTFLNDSSFFSTVDFLTGVTAEEGAGFMHPSAGISDDPEHFEPSRTNFVDTLIPMALQLTFSLGAHVPEIIKDLVVHEYTDWTDPEHMEKIRNKLVQLYSDLVQIVPTIQTVRWHASVSKESKRSYMYVFSVHPYNVFEGTPSWIKGTLHGDDLEYLFFDETAGIMTLMPGKDGYSPQKWEGEIAEYMMTMWTNFAKTGNPNKPTPVRMFWPAYTKETQHYLQISRNMTSDSVKSHLRAKEFNFWDSIIPKVYKAIDDSKR